MKYKLFIFFILIFSCSSNYTKVDNRKSYSASGFAYIFNENDYELKKIKKKLNNEYFQIAHKDLRVGTLIKLINPKTKESIVLKNLKKIDYPDFYKILITKPVAVKLKIDKELPLIEILEIKKNKSFIAKRAKIFEEETKIPLKAPVTSGLTSYGLARLMGQKNPERAALYSALTAVPFSFMKANAMANTLGGDVSAMDLLMAPGGQPITQRNLLTMKKEN